MSAATDTLQEKRNDQAAKIREMAGRQDEWDQEQRDNWVLLNSDYDVTMTELEAAIEAEEQSRQVAGRLKAIEAQDKIERSDRKVGLDHQERQRAEPEAQAGAAEERAALVMQAFLLRANDLDLRQEHRDACRILGVDLNRKTLEVPLSRLAYHVSPPAWCSGAQMRARALWVTHGGKPEQRALSAITGAAGQYTIPEGFSGSLENTLLAFGGPRGQAMVIRTDGVGDYPYPTVDDTSNSGEIISENTSIGSSTEPTFGAVILRGFKYSSKPVLVPQELLEDSAFQLATLIGDMLGERIGRAQGAHMTTGSGSVQPYGLITKALSGGTTVTAASATAIGADEVIDLAHSIDVAYRQTGKAVGFMCHDDRVASLRKLKNSDDYLWVNGLQAGVPDRLYNYPLSINNHMDSGTIASGHESLLFGDFNKYVVRDMGSMRLHRLEERYRDLDQTGFIAFQRTDANSIQDSAFAVLQH